MSLLAPSRSSSIDDNFCDATQFYSNLVPYFIRTQNTSDFVASLALVISALGVALGGIVCGLVIKRYLPCGYLLPEANRVSTAQNTANP